MTTLPWHKLYCAVAAAVMLVFASGPADTTAGDRPKLVLQITVDQLRGDLPFRYRERFGAGGFRYLMEHGTWFTFAYHPHAVTETAVGHTTLVTGAYPSRHGIIANKWHDQHGASQDNFKDSQYTLVGTTEPSVSPRQLDPTTTTFGDELISTTNGRAKVFAVSVKDRSAVAMAGRMGKALWFSSQTGHFVSSTYYYERYPAWVTDWNQKALANAFLRQDWNLLYERSTYVFAASDNTAYPPRTPPACAMEALEKQHKFGSNFPHHFGDTPSVPYYTALTISPVGDELTVDFAMALLTQEQLGVDDIPDYLGVSLSATDLIGHWFSPASLESEDNMLRLDRTLARLFTAIDTQVGLANTLIVLAGDHGGSEFPEYLQQLNVPTGRMTAQHIRSMAEQALYAQFGKQDLIAAYKHPYFYVNRATVAASQLPQEQVEQVIARAVMQLDGVLAALPSSALRKGEAGIDQQLMAQIRHSDYPGRSGDVYVLQRLHWQVDEQPDSCAGTPNTAPLEHGSPWIYDTYVPIVFAGWQVPAAREVARPVSTVDVVATLATALGTKLPSGAVGVPLMEALGSHARAPASGR